MQASQSLAHAPSSDATCNPLKGAKVPNAYLLGGRSNRCAEPGLPFDDQTNSKNDFPMSTNFSN